MNCPTCNFGLADLHGGTRHCWRCGTIVLDSGRALTPSLVKLCRDFAGVLAREEPHGTPETAWHRNGIAEAIGRKPA